MATKADTMADMRTAMVNAYPALIHGCHSVPPSPFMRRQASATVAFGLEPLGSADPVPPANPTVQVANIGPQGFALEGPSQLVQPQQSDVADDAAQAHVLLNLQALGEDVGGVFVVSQLGWGRYLHDPAWAAARHQWGTERARFPVPEDLDSPGLTEFSDGECDVILIDRQGGVILIEVKSIGLRFRLTEAALIKRLQKVNHLFCSTVCFM